MAKETSSWRCFSGFQKVFQHDSSALNCGMTFGAYVPDHQPDEKLPVLFYLSGLTCTHANMMEKSGFQRYASQHRMIVVHPDTSPRGVDLPGDSDSWDFGKGAGFYVDATEEPWSKHYRMYSYVTEELHELIKDLLPADGNRIGIFGHSMGGHGAIVLGIRNPEIFKSISAFAPICHPTNCPWGQKALKGYLGSDESKWRAYDAALLLNDYDGPTRRILVDQGGADSFLSGGQLQPESLKVSPHVAVDCRLQEQYDHSYYFIASFMADHFEHHAQQLAK